MKTLLALLLLVQNPADLYKSAVADMDNGRWAEAAATFEKILRDDPGHVPTEFNLAVCYTKLEKLDEAKQVYRKILEQDAQKGSLLTRPPQAAMTAYSPSGVR